MIVPLIFLGNNGPAGSCGNTQSNAAFSQPMKVGFSNALKGARKEARYDQATAKLVQNACSESLRKDHKIEGEI